MTEVTEVAGRGHLGEGAQARPRGGEAAGGARGRLETKSAGRGRTRRAIGHGVCEGGGGEGACKPLTSARTPSRCCCNRRGHPRCFGRRRWTTREPGGRREGGQWCECEEHKRVFGGTACAHRVPSLPPFLGLGDQGGLSDTNVGPRSPHRVRAPAARLVRYVPGCPTRRRNRRS